MHWHPLRSLARAAVLALAVLGTTFAVFASVRSTSLGASPEQSPAANLVVTPNSPYAAGINAVVVQGGGPAESVVGRIAQDSGLGVLALWMFGDGSWRFFLPGAPTIDGGLRTFPDVAAAIVALTPSPSDVAIVAVGDIASCDSLGDEATAALLDTLPGPVLTLGDTVYEAGTPAELADCFEPSWGRHKPRIHPVPGNHEYLTPGASGYFQYFGAAAGDPSKGYYSYDLGAWHILALNSNCANLGGCGPTSAQYAWLKGDLAAHPSTCTLAYYHHPTLTAGPQLSNQGNMLDLWRLLYDNRVDLALVGHDHNYQRFGPLNRDSNAAATAGIRQIIVGTGGQGITNIDPARAASTPGLQVWADYNLDGDGHDTSPGVLRVTLRATDYRWQFVSTDGQFSDSGTAPCWP